MGKSKYDVRNIRTYYNDNYCGTWTAMELSEKLDLEPRTIVTHAKKEKPLDRLLFKTGITQKDTKHNQKCRQRLGEMMEWCKDIALPKPKEQAAEQVESEQAEPKEEQKETKGIPWERHIVKDKPKMTECPYYLNDSGREERPWLNR